VVKTLFVGNLPWGVSEEDLSGLFAPYTEVISARVATDRDTGRSRGFGFVEVPEAQAQAAIDALNGAEVGGRQLTVNEARPREDRTRSRSRY
jgi:RNA recognition motif-containing protein